MAKDGEKITIELEVVLDLKPALAQVEALKAVLMEMAKSSSVQEDKPKECFVSKDEIVREPISNRSC